MNQNDTIALWRECETKRKEALLEGKTENEAHLAATVIWNRWTTELLVERNDLIDANEWSARRISSGAWQAGNTRTREWLEKAAVDFSGICMDKAEAAESDDENSLQSVTEMIRFDAWIFPGHARFDRTRFLRTVRFDGAKFDDMSSFRKARFSDRANFQRAEFFGDARFDKAEFFGTARFGKAEFHHEARFDNVKFQCNKYAAIFEQCRFRNYASFSGCTFSSEANFEAIHSASKFNLAEVTFEALPNFIQANFKEPPRFDHLTLKTPLVTSEPKKPKGCSHVALRNRIMQCFKVSAGRSRQANEAKNYGSNQEKDDASKFRALKALAIRAHDREREHLFFKGDL